MVRFEGFVAADVSLNVNIGFSALADEPSAVCVLCNDTDVPSLLASTFFVVDGAPKTLLVPFVSFALFIAGDVLFELLN